MAVETDSLQTLKKKDMPPETTQNGKTFHTSIFLTYICYLCDWGVDLPQFSGGVWCSRPQREPYRKPAAE